MQDVPYSLVFMSAVIFLPLLFAAFLLIPKLFFADRTQAMRWWALFGTALTLTLSLCMVISYYYDVVQFHLSDPAGGLLSARAPTIDGTGGSTAPTPSQTWVIRYPWIPSLNIQYYFGVDGISMTLVLLTSVLMFLAVIASWRIEKQVRGYLALLLLFEGGVIGSFLALDFFLFFVFSQVILLPLYFLMGYWGAAERPRSANRFLLYHVAASALVLIVMAACHAMNMRDLANPELVAAETARIHRAHPELTMSQARDQVSIHSFDLILLQKAGAMAAEVVRGDRPATSIGEQPFFHSRALQTTMFLLLFVGFAVRAAVAPFHRWLPDAQAEAATPVCMILAGVMLSTGAYGFMRLAWPLFPAAAVSLTTLVGLLAVISITYGAFAALCQTDFKRMVAWSSVSFMGYVLLGIAVSSSSVSAGTWGLNGAMLQLVAHAVTVAGLFFLIGMLQERAGAAGLGGIHGLIQSMPVSGAFGGVLFFGALALAGVCGAVGACWIILATWSANWLYSVVAALAGLLTAGAIVRSLQRTWLGSTTAERKLPDIRLQEVCCLLPLAGLAVVVVCLPNLLLSWMQPSLAGLVEMLTHIPH